MIIKGARLFLACLLVVTGFSKFAYLPHFARALAAYRAAPKGWAPFIARSLATLEVIVGLCLFSARLAPWPEICAGGLFFLFSLAVATALLRSGPKPPCGCWGRMGRSKTPVGYKTVLRNLVLIALAALATGMHAVARYALWAVALASCALLLAAIPGLAPGTNARRSAERATN